MSSWRTVCIGLLLWGQAVGAAPSWVLHGTIVQGEQAGFAILRDPHCHQQRLYRHGSRLDNGLVLAAIYPTYVHVRQPDGTQQRIEFGQTLVRVETARPLARRQVFSLIDSMSRANPPLQVLPHQQDGKLNGFYINDVHDPLLAGKLGLQRGDVIHSVNNISLGEMADPGRLLHTLLNETDLQVQIKRAGQDLTLRYRVQ